MSIEHTQYMTQLRDGAAMRLIGVMADIHCEMFMRGFKETPPNNEAIAADAWELADVWIKERQRRYGPKPASDIAEENKDG